MPGSQSSRRGSHCQLENDAHLRSRRAASPSTSPTPISSTSKILQNGGVDYSDPTDMDTEVTILQSDLLALQVIKALNLDKLPEYGGTALQRAPSTTWRPTLCRRFRANLGLAGRLQGRPASSAEAEYTHRRDPLRQPESPTCRRDREHPGQRPISSRTSRRKFESTMQASDWLSKQLVDLQMKVETSQEKLVDFRKNTRSSVPMKSRTSSPRSWPSSTKS